MLQRLTDLLTQRRPEERRLVASVPEGERIYAVGDMHGRPDLLEKLLKILTADAEGYTGRITFVGIGDYIDRGPDSQGVIKRLLNDVPKDWKTVFIRGNHEQAMLDFLQLPSLRTEWLAWGGLNTLESYAVAPYGAKGMRDPEALAAEFLLTLAETEHLFFFKETQLSYTVGNYAFVHAGVRAGIPLEKQMDNDLLFIREDFFGRAHDLPYRVVFGHTILSEPLVQDDRIGLDTGAFQSGVLTAVRLENDTVKILQATAD